MGFCTSALVRLGSTWLGWAEMGSWLAPIVSWVSDCSPKSLTFLDVHHSGLAGDEVACSKGLLCTQNVCGVLGAGEL